jgi:hypothetical protein
MIREWEYSLVLSCNHLLSRITMNEIADKKIIPMFEECYRSINGRNVWCGKCRKSRKVIGWQKELVNIIYTNAKEERPILR